MSLTVTDVVVKTGHVHEETEDAVGRHVDQISIQQLMPKYFLQHRRQLPDVIKWVDQYKRLHALGIFQRIHQRQSPAQ